MSTKISQHVDPATLMSFAAGSLSESLAAVVAAHVAMCPHCQDELDDMELMGSLLLSSLPMATSNPGTIPRKPSAADGRSPIVSRTSYGDDRLPGPIAARYGLSFERIPWKRLGPGVWHHRLPLTRKSGGDLRLLKIAAGRRMPEHGHGGSELTLVLDGSYADESGVFNPGDIQDVDQQIEHEPVADKECGCICLVASEYPARFKGRLMKLIQPLTGM